jgi:hypothetical protein
MKRLKSIHAWWQNWGECFTIPAMIVCLLWVTCELMHFYQQVRLK